MKNKTFETVLVWVIILLLVGAVLYLGSLFWMWAYNTLLITWLGLELPQAKLLHGFLIMCVLSAIGGSRSSKG